jgi:uncharacterized protein with GYD domain
VTFHAPIISALADAPVRLHAGGENERKGNQRHFEHKGEVIPMPDYIMLTNLTADGVQTLKNNPSRVQEVNKEVEQLGVKVKEQWATLGQYDFITVVEAPDTQTMAKVSVELGSRGTMTSQTMAALPAEELAKAL